ncbi:MAG: hypothetical protein AAB895_02145, partial [Patescibacteria group bacterium]
ALTLPELNLAQENKNMDLHPAGESAYQKVHNKLNYESGLQRFFEKEERRKAEEQKTREALQQKLVSFKEEKTHTTSPPKSAKYDLDQCRGYGEK